MNTQVGEKIHDLRLYLGLSLKAFGDEIGYTGTHGGWWGQAPLNFYKIINLDIRTIEIVY